MIRKIAFFAVAAAAFGTPVVADENLKWVDVNAQIPMPTVYASAPQTLTATGGFTSWWRTGLASSVISFSSKVASGFILLFK